MRFLFVIFCLFLFGQVHSQDKKLLKKQMMQLGLAYRNKFRDIKNDGFAYDFKLTGTTGETMKQLRADTMTASLAIRLAREGNEEEIDAIYNKWSELINTMDFNGARLVAKDETGDGKFSTKLRIWKIDNSSGQIDPKYQNFSITLEILKVGKTYHPYMMVGDK